MGSSSKKPRTTILDFAFEAPTLINSYRIGLSGEIEFFSGTEKVFPAKSEIRTSYERKKAPKILNTAPLPPKSINFHPDVALSRFDHLFAVDTNTVQTITGSLSVSCIVLCIFQPTDGGIRAEFAPINCLEFRKVNNNPEHFAWKKTIELICANPAYKPTLSIGLVVDCDFGKLKQYNSRTEPIFEDFFLPRGFTLLYATSDSGKDYLANQLIAKCDSLAKNLINFLRKIQKSSNRLLKNWQKV